MACGGTSDRRVLEIAPPLLLAGRVLVVGQLHRLLTSRKPARWSTGKNHALLLAALNFQLARRLLDDLDLGPQPLTPRRWRWKLREGAEHIPVSGIVWSGVGSAQAQPLPRTHAFIAELPEALVRQVLAWAPPLVEPTTDRYGYSAVVANHLSALLARQRLLGQQVQVLRMCYATAQHRTLPEIAQSTVHALQPIYEQHRRRIVELALDQSQAHLLTGYSRAQYFRIKGGEG